MDALDKGPFFLLQMQRFTSSLKQIRTTKLRSNTLNSLKKTDLIQSQTYPVFAFENALKIASGMDIYKAYKTVAENEKVVELNVGHYVTLLQRIIRGHFGFLGGLSLFQFALQLRKDFIGSGRKPSIEFETLVIECGKYLSLEHIPRVLLHAQNVLQTLVKDQEKESILKKIVV